LSKNIKEENLIMAKPILIIRYDRLKVLKDEKNYQLVVNTVKALHDELKEEYHVIAVEEQLKIEVLNGLLVELNQEQIEKLQEKLNNIKGE
jgi:hypothetical protein